jgi:hypothetical protein
MKTKHLILLFALFFLSNVQSQVNPNAIGVRGGGFLGSYGGEISYQHGFGESNRLELDLGWRSHHYNNGKGNDNLWYYNQFSVTGIYHWVFNITEGLNWYIGPGAQVGFYDDYYDNNSGVSIALGGQIGLEYDFNVHDVPLLLSLDARPMFDFIGFYSGFGGGGAFSLRYTF